MNGFRKMCRLFGVWLFLPAVVGLVLHGFGAPPAFPAQGEEGRREGRLALASAGRTVFRVACAPCHGLEGRGNGVAASGFEFAPSDFRAGDYKFRSTEFDAPPTGGDIARTIRQGVPGTEMVPFGTILSRNSIAALVAYLQSLSPTFDDPAAPLAELETPGSSGETARMPTAESVAAGRELFQSEECASCHGVAGDGQGPDAEDLTDDRERPVRMTDFRRGVFKSGYTAADLYRTIATGMNGTPMEGYAEAISQEERWRLVDFIQSLAGGQNGFFAYLLSDAPSGLAYER